MPNHHILYAGLYIIMMTYQLGTRRNKTINNQTFSREQKVILTYKNKELFASGYYDTGNLLYDTYTKNPVIIVDYKILKNWVTKEAYSLFEEYNKTGEFDYPAFAQLSGIKMYPLPFQTIGIHFKMMPAFCLSSLTFKSTGKSYKAVTAGISQYSFMHGANHQILLHESLKPIREEYSND